MLEKSKLKQLLLSWVDDRGQEIRGKYYVAIEGRVDMYKDLMKTLIELHGYQEEDLRTTTLLLAVMDASVPVHYPNKAALAIWKEEAEKDWFRALNVFFKQKVLVHDVESEPKREPVIRKKYEKAPPKPKASEEEIVITNPLDRSLLPSFGASNDVDDVDFLNAIEAIKNE